MTDLRASLYRVYRFPFKGNKRSRRDAIDSLFRRRRASIFIGSKLHDEPLRISISGERYVARNDPGVPRTCAETVIPGSSAESRSVRVTDARIVREIIRAGTIVV